MAKRNSSSGGSSSVGTNVETCFGILSATQDQIRFADTKAAFLFGINTLMFGFVASTSGLLKQSLAQQGASAASVIAIVALVVFGVAASGAVVILISAVMSRFGELAPKSRAYFGHIARQYGKDYAKYVGEIQGMSEDDWTEELGTQIVEVSHIALAKHKWIWRAGVATIVSFACWLVCLVAVALLP